MQFTVATALFSLALATLGLAAPAANPPAGAVDVVQRSPDADTELDLSKRAPRLVYICPAFDWASENGLECTTIPWTIINKCAPLSAQTYRYTISAVGPDPGLWCVLYTSGDCSSGGSDGFSYPGMKKLDGYWSTWNDNTGSIKCWW